MLQNKKIYLSKDKQKANLAAYVLDLRSVGGTRKFFWTRKEAEQKLKKIK